MRCVDVADATDSTGAHPLGTIFAILVHTSIDSQQRALIRARALQRPGKRLRDTARNATPWAPGDNENGGGAN